MYFKSLSVSPLGSIIFIWYLIKSKPGIIHILLPSMDYTAGDLSKLLYPGAVQKTCRAVDSTAEKVKLLVQGKISELSLDIFYLESLRPFEQRVLRTVHKIPRGKVSSYKHIANAAGSPGASRAVGTAMAQNPYPLVIPCHRVIKSDRNPGGFGSGPEIKQKLLQLEGIRFDNNGRVLVDQMYSG